MIFLRYLASFPSQWIPLYPHFLHHPRSLSSFHTLSNQGTPNLLVALFFLRLRQFHALLRLLDFLLRLKHPTQNLITLLYFTAITDMRLLELFLRSKSINQLLEAVFQRFAFDLKQAFMIDICSLSGLCNATLNLSILCDVCTDSTHLSDDDKVVSRG